MLLKTGLFQSILGQIHKMINRINKILDKTYLGEDAQRHIEDIEVIESEGVLAWGDETHRLSNSDDMLIESWDCKKYILPDSCFKNGEDFLPVPEAQKLKQEYINAGKVEKRIYKR